MNEHELITLTIFKARAEAFNNELEKIIDGKSTIDIVDACYEKLRESLIEVIALIKINEA